MSNDPFGQEVVRGPIPPEERETLPSDWVAAVPACSDYKVGQLERAARLYLAGHSCAQCQVKTGVNAESLRGMMADLGLTRSKSESQHVRHLKGRRHVKRLLESPVGYGTEVMCRLTGLGKKAVIGYRRDWKRGVPLTDWTST